MHFWYILNDGLVNKITVSSNTKVKCMYDPEIKPVMNSKT